MTDRKIISAAFQFEPNFLDEGDKNSKHTFLLLHGNPTSSYLWRNIIPHLTKLGRVVAPDLIGMGKSGKPNIDYTFKDYISYLDTFIEKLALKNIEKLALKNIVLVIQDWGSGLGFNYANQHRENVSGIAFFEAIVQVSYWKNMNEFDKTHVQKVSRPC